MLLASVDLGSNSFRLEIGRVEGSRVLHQSYWKESVRLSAGFDEDGCLTEEVQMRALATLARFNERIKTFPKAQVRAVGTQALRIAKNSPEFIQKAERVLGFPIEILRGREEARLVFEGCSYRLPASNAKRFIVDIGGGSTEFVIGQGHKAQMCESYHVGCVNTTIGYFADGKITDEQFEKAQLFVQSEITEAYPEFNINNWDEAYGSSGTMDAISTILRIMGLSEEGEVTSEHLAILRKLLIQQGEISRLELPGLMDNRREVIVGGLVVLSAVFETLKIKVMHPCTGALRVGLLYDLLDRKCQQDIREESAQALLNWTSVDKEQAQRVQSLSLSLFNQVCPQASDEDKKLLGWASLLHEIGGIISHNGYHRHTAYVLANCDLAGFSRPNQECLSTLVLAQRGNLLKVEKAIQRAIYRAQIISIRLAVIFAHTRLPTELPTMKLTVKENGFKLSLCAQWLQQHPLTHFLLENEVVFWNKVKYDFELELID